MTLCQKLRQRDAALPVLMLTARDTVADRIMGLDAGADDYIVKPFDLQELMARVRALLRRGNVTRSPGLEWGALRLDTSTFEVNYVVIPTFNPQGICSVGTAGFKRSPGAESIEHH